MKLIKKSTALLCMLLFYLPLYAEGKAVLDLNFETDLLSQSDIIGGTVITIQALDNVIFDAKRKSRFLYFNGVSDNLEIEASQETEELFANTFTLEFDFISSKTPHDKNYHDPGTRSIEIFSALDSHGKKCLSFYLNQYNRFTVYWFNSEGKRYQHLTTWNHVGNYELASIQRNKWYRVSLVNNPTQNKFEIYLDGEKLGEMKTVGTLKKVKKVRFGGNLKSNQKSIFSGGIDNLSLLPTIVHTKKTDAVARKKSWQRLHDAANKEIKLLLLPESPEWAENHPKMILTPARIEGGDDLFKATNFSKITNWLPYVLYPNSKKTMSLKYAHDGITGLNNINSYLTAFLRQKLKTPQAEWCWQRLHKDQALDKKWDILSLIWFEPEKEKLVSPDLPLSKWFKSEGFVAFRSDWTEDAIAGIFMAYPAKMASHDQTDRGQFTLYGYQGRWIIDNGGRGKPQHAWRDAHNLITVDNKVPMQKARLMSNFHHDAFMTNFCAADSVMTVAEADVTQSYKYTYTWGHKKRANEGKQENAFKDAKRKIIYMREKHAPDYLLVYDTIQQDEKEHAYTLNLHTDAQNEVVIENDKAEFSQYPLKSKKEFSYLSWPGEKDASGNYFYTGKPYNGDPKFGSAEYKIKIPSTGKYNLYGFACSGEKKPHAMDSFFIKLGKQKTAWGFSNYSWVKINKKPYELHKGEEILTVLAREPESKVMRFALYSVDAGIPIFNKPNNPNLIMIDAGKPDAMVNNFVVGIKQVPDHAIDPVVAANMTLWQLAPRTGFSSEVFDGHIRLQVKTTSVRGQFLNFFYPRKPGMQQPTRTEISENTSLITWEECQDIICFNKAEKISSEGIVSDADLVLIRKNGDVVISFVMVNGSYLNFNNQQLIKLAGGKGVAGWADDTLSVSGKNVFNFTFSFPVESKGFFSVFAGSKSLKKVIADGEKIKVVEGKKGWSAVSPFAGTRVLTW